MASNRARCLSGIAIVAALSITTAAYADPTAAEKETARAQMATGREKREKGDLDGALKAFQAADAIMHVPTTGYEVAVTQAEMGLLVESRDTLLRVLRIPEGANEPAAFKEARKKAQAMSDALEERIPSLKITLKGAADKTGAPPKVTVDQIALPDAALGAPFRVNPGHHVVSAKSDKASGQQAVDVKEHETKSVEVELTTTEAETPAEPPSEETKPEEKPQPPPPPASSGLGTLTWVGFGVAAAGVVAGSITGLLSMSSTSSAQSGCRNNQCPPSTWNDIDSASTMATVSTISFVVAGVGAGIGIYGLLTRGSAPAQPAAEAPKSEARVRVTPWIGVGSAGVRGSF